MASIQQTSFATPSYDYGADISGIERRRALAQMLQQQGMQNAEAPPTAGPGAFQAPISPFQGLAKMAQTYAGVRQQQKSEDEQRTLAAKAQKDLADVLRRGQMASAGTAATPISEDASGNVTPAQAAVPGDASKAASIYLQHPQTAQLGSMMMQKEIEQQARQRLMADLMKGAAQQGATAGGPWSPEYAAAQSAAGNPLAGVDPKVLGMVLSGDAEVSKLGMHMLGRGETQGRVSYDQNGNAFTVGKDGKVIPLTGIKHRDELKMVNTGNAFVPYNPYTQTQPIQMGISPKDLAQGRFEGWLPAPQAANPNPAPAPQPSPTPAPTPAPAPTAPPAAAPSNLPPKAAVGVEADRQKYLNELISKRGFNMANIGDVLDSGEMILSGGGKNTPTGSGIGTGVDAAGAFFGKTPRGAIEADRLRAIGGALVSKMPRMEGPQSDRDVIMYREMAGRVGDSTIPVDRRLEALREVRRLWAKYDPQAKPEGSVQANDPLGIRRR